MSGTRKLESLRSPCRSLTAPPPARVSRLLLLRDRAAVHLGRVNALTTAAAIVVILSAPRAFAQINPTLVPAVLDELRQGGLIVACRHAITSHDREDKMPPSFDDPSTQRLLSTEGEQQARTLGQDLAALNIRFGVVLASPFDRTKRSAELMAGRVQINEALSSMSRGTNTELRALMSGPVEPGSNRLLVTHQGLLYRSFSSLRQGSVAEGDCVVARPRDGEAEVLAVVKPAEWARLK